MPACRSVTPCRPNYDDLKTQLDGLTKRAQVALEEGYFDIQRLNITPFKVVDSFEKAIYNYQYYNTMAKYYYLQAHQIK